MTQLLTPAAPGTMNIRGVGMGFPGTHNSAREAGDGPITIDREIYYLKGIVNNVVAASTRQHDWTIENAALSLPWSQPIAFTFFLTLMRINENRSCVALGTLGGDASTNALLDFDQWRLGTQEQRKRVGIYIERDAAANIVWRLGWGDGVTQNSITMPSISDLSWVSIIYTPSPRAAEVYVNNNLHIRTTDAFLPTGVQTDGLLLTLGVLKRIASVPEVSYRIYAPSIMPARIVS